MSGSSLLAGVDLNLLVALDALLDEGSVTGAAARMSVGQSAMSASLKRLRVLFDDPLLVRQGRSMITTPRADALAEPVRSALAAVQRALAANTAFDPRADRRTFTVVASDYAAYVLLRPLIARLDQEAPGVRLNLRPVGTDYLATLRRGETDLLVIPPQFVDGSDLLRRHLFSDRWVCAVDGGHPPAGDELTPAEFSSRPYLSYRAGGLPSLAEQQLDAEGVPRNVEATVETFVLALYLLRGTRLLTLVHARLAEELAGEIGVQLLEPPMPLPRTTEVMVWPPRLEHDPAHTWLRGRLLELAVELAPAGRVH